MRGTVSPFNGDTMYWSQRLRQHPLTTGSAAILLKRQQGRCAWCGSLFMERAAIEVDHVRPRIFNGTTDLTNLRACMAIVAIRNRCSTGQPLTEAAIVLHAKNHVD